MVANGGSRFSTKSKLFTVFVVVPFISFYFGNRAEINLLIEWLSQLSLHDLQAETAFETLLLQIPSIWPIFCPFVVYSWVFYLLRNSAKPNLKITNNEPFYALVTLYTILVILLKLDQFNLVYWYYHWAAYVILSLAVTIIVASIPGDELNSGSDDLKSGVEFAMSWTFWLSLVFLVILTPVCIAGKLLAYAFSLAQFTIKLPIETETMFSLSTSSLFSIGCLFVIMVPVAFLAISSLYSALLSIRRIIRGTKRVFVPVSLLAFRSFHGALLGMGRTCRKIEKFSRDS